MFKKIVLLALISFLVFSCTKEKPVEITPPVPVMYAATNQTSNTCELYGAVEIEGTNAVLFKGFCWALDTLPDLSDVLSENGNGAGVFDTIAYNLNSQTKYHVRAYARTSAGIYYSNGVTFNTQ